MSRRQYIKGAACKNCKSKKHRCDNEKPQCRYCAKRNLKCERVNWKKRGRKSNDTPFQIISPAITINQRNSDCREQSLAFDDIFSHYYEDIGRSVEQTHIPVNQDDSFYNTDMNLLNNYEVNFNSQGENFYEGLYYLFC
ncbi:1857_t:CDS:1 [Scutellospora calospora]|uniref:1857_t:CDS:1 n=1 Tax=Scutellospora calospora TaxID=85575 RepID=A0ACA9LUI0_9GLOM|nr:1857_t:CDS:1 [Scutellospora calospora]